MAKGDIRIKDAAGHNVVPTWTWQTEAAAGDLFAGEPCKLKSAGSPYVIRLADGDPVIGSTTQMVGITASDSTHTSTADGTVEVYMPLAGIVYASSAKTAAGVDTQSELDALVGDNVVLDLTSDVFTIDAAAANGATNGVQIVGGDPTLPEVYWTIRPAAAEGAIA